METARTSSALENLLKMFGLSNMPTVPTSDEDTNGEADEPPDQPLDLSSDRYKDPSYARHMAPRGCVRRESLLTRAIMSETKPTDSSFSVASQAVSSRTMSTASSQSLASTAELTSDGDLTSPTRSVSPSPPLLSVRFPDLSGKPPVAATRVMIATATTDDKVGATDIGEAAVEKSLGRKRCIMFACADTPSDPVKEPVKSPPASAQRPQFEEPRKCRLTFACPTRQDSNQSVSADKVKFQTQRTPSQIAKGLAEEGTKATPTVLKTELVPVPKSQTTSPVFHEFGTSQQENDAWVDEPAPVGPKLTLDDCNKKENAIRRIAEEAEEEAEAEEMEKEELEDEDDEDQDGIDDFAPSDDDDESDGGNESDDEGGFAASDDDSDDGSDYQFWAPATGPLAINTDNLTHFSSRRSRSSSIDSAQSRSVSSGTGRISTLRRKTRAGKLRPGTPELPDSTDFVCGTLDEDRPLEAAFIACREQRKRDKEIVIPQDIDPSFPTSDPEDDQDEEADDLVEPQWIVDQLLSEESTGRRPSAFKVSPGQAPAILRPEPTRPGALKKPTNRSPPPPRYRSPPPPKQRSLAPRRLFSQSPTRLRSPPPAGRYRSPRGSPLNVHLPLGITINRLAQRPSTTKTASLPHTPNPFFRNWERGSPPVSRIASAAVTPMDEVDEPRPDLHVRGPVDIVIGLEKKRQKRKEKFWRQHCRKAAKEQAERKPVPGRGVERMKELGLEIAERTRGYGLGQQAQLVLSL